jgi:uncharacterized membrane protein YraQ (UPF0718 family)
MKRGRGAGGWIFLALVSAAYVVVAIARPELGQRAWGSFVELLQRVAPALLLVWILMFVVQLLLGRERIERWLGARSGARGWLLACASGVLAGGPIYPWYALLADLHGKGMRTPLVAVFLYSRALKLPLLPLMAHYFGGRFVAVLSLLIVVFAFVSGGIVMLLERRRTLVRPPAR